MSRYGLARSVPQDKYGPPDFRNFEVINPTDVAVFEGPDAREERMARPGWQEPEVRWSGPRGKSFYIDQLTHDLIWADGLRQWFIGVPHGKDNWGHCLGGDPQRWYFYHCTVHRRYCCPGYPFDDVGHNSCKREYFGVGVETWEDHVQKLH